jgi:ferric iron reductase protein FhuF
MRHGDGDLEETSPITAIYRELQGIHPNWHVAVGEPHGTGWIRGTELRTAVHGPLSTLLTRAGASLQTSDRRTIAASFIMCYSWSCGIAIAPYLLRQCVPNIALDNVSFKFHENTFFQMAALHRPEGIMLHQDGCLPHRSIEWLSNPQELMNRLRDGLMQQAEPVVEAIYNWSHFSIRGMWGLVTSSWGAQFFSIFGALGGQERGLPHVRQFFQGHDIVAQMQPDFYPVTFRHVTHIYHRRASCCRFYKIPQGQLCASCPIVSHEERLQRNRAYMKYLLDRH